MPEIILRMIERGRCFQHYNSVGDFDTNVYKFANFERFFCCNTCKTQYKEKNKGRIQSLIEKTREEN